MLRIWERAKSLCGKKAAAGVFLLALLVVVDRPAQGQFGIDLAAILAGLKAVNSALQSAVGSPLKNIQSIESNITTYERTVLYPATAITQLKNDVVGFETQVLKTNSIMNVPYTSVQMPTTQQLENLLVSNDPNSIASVDGAYQQVYGSLPSNTQAPTDVRYMIDMGDAQAMDAMKKAIQLEALAARELEVSADLQTQIANATPGTAPMVEAVAAAWVVRANAYSQSAMAQLMRVRSTAVANQSALLKRSTAGSNNLSDQLQQVLTRP